MDLYPEQFIVLQNDRCFLSAFFKTTLSFKIKSFEGIFREISFV